MEQEFYAGQKFATKKGHRMEVQRLIGTQCVEVKLFVHKSSANHSQHGMPTSRYFVQVFEIEEKNFGLRAKIAQEGYKGEASIVYRAVATPEIGGGPGL